MSISMSMSMSVQQGSDGGALQVKHGGEAVFLVPVHFAANSVADGYSGGALHVDGEVRVCFCLFNSLRGLESPWDHLSGHD